MITKCVRKRQGRTRGGKRTLCWRSRSLCQRPKLQAQAQKLKEGLDAHEFVNVYCLVCSESYQQWWERTEKFMWCQVHSIVFPCHESALALHFVGTLRGILNIGWNLFCHLRFVMYVRVWNVICLLEWLDFS